MSDSNHSTIQRKRIQPLVNIDEYDTSDDDSNNFTVTQQDHPPARKRVIVIDPCLSDDDDDDVVIDNNRTELIGEKTDNMEIVEQQQSLSLNISPMKKKDMIVPLKLNEICHIRVNGYLNKKVAFRGEGTKGKGTHDSLKFLPQLPDIRVKPEWMTPQPPLFIPGKHKLNEVGTESKRFLQELTDH
ncbi:unnamed protein product, partial [Didymodactylos carnosus]